MLLLQIINKISKKYSSALSRSVPRKSVEVMENNSRISVIIVPLSIVKLLNETPQKQQQEKFQHETILL